MAAKDEEVNPAEQLLELLVYAPIGLLYEYEDVLPKLVKRGKSQVQIARLIGQVAVKGVSKAPKVDTAVTGAADMLATAMTKAITDVGSMLGLAPPSQESETPPSTQPPPPPHSPPPQPLAETAPPETATSPDEATETQPLPIARYDELTAREIVGLLGDLTPAQRERIRAHEESARGRKTVLGKLDRLDE